MSRRRAGLTWPVLLLAACAAAGARLYDEWSRAPAASEASAPAAGIAAPAASVVEAALALPPPAPPPTADAAAPAQPETAPEPVATEAPAPAPAPPPAVDFTLVGVITAGTERHALVQRQDTGAVVEVPEGGDISGWFAVLIDPDRAIFRQAGTEQELVLHFDAPVPADRIPAPRPRPPPNIAPAAQPTDNTAADKGTPPQ